MEVGDGVGRAITVAAIRASTVASMSGVGMGVSVGNAAATAASTVASMSGVGMGVSVGNAAATAASTVASRSGVRFVMGVSLAVEQPTRKRIKASRLGIFTTQILTDA